MHDDLHSLGPIVAAQKLCLLSWKFCIPSPLVILEIRLKASAGKDIYDIDSPRLCKIKEDIYKEMSFLGKPHKSQPPPYFPTSTLSRHGSMLKKTENPNDFQ